MNKSKIIEAKGLDYLSLALYAFGGLGIEAIYAFMLEPMIYGKQMADWSVSQNIIHWVVTCITWGIITWLIIRYSKQKYGFDIFVRENKMKLWQWLGVALCIIFSISVSYMDWDGFKVVKEFEKKGLLKFIFQYIYYIFETALFTMILVYAQKAFEVWFKRKNIPYGGIILAVTW